MSAKSEQLKGHAKEAAGIVIGDQRLQDEGRSDRVAGEVKGRVEQVKVALEALMDTGEAKASQGIDRAADAVVALIDKAKVSLRGQ
jgi:uncharacterized protein YjbJ (UPF0337 family)